jgi:hypothetical protein
MAEKSKWSALTEIDTKSKYKYETRQVSIVVLVTFKPPFPAVAVFTDGNV